MSALDKWMSSPLLVRDFFNPMVSKDALEKPRHSRSGFAGIHNAFAIHGKEQSYETDLEPVMVQKGRYLNPPSNPSKLNTHWGFDNEPDGPFINGGYPSVETNTFIRANEPMRLTQFQRKPRDPTKEPEMFHIVGNRLPDYKEKEFISLDTYTQRAIRDQVYADGTPRSGTSMDMAMASQQQSQQQGQNDKLLEIMGAIMQSADDTKRMANIMQLASGAPLAPPAPEVVPVSEYMKQRQAVKVSVEKKFDEILKQRPDDIRRQILQAQQFAADVEEQFKAEQKEVPPEFLSFAEKLQAFKDDEFQQKWGESERVKKSQMLKENKEAIKALAGLLENVPVYTEVSTPMSSRKPSLIPQEEEEKILEQAPSEAQTMTKSQKEKAMMDALIATIPQQPVRETVYKDGQARTLMIQGNIIYESLGREMKPIGSISTEDLKKYGGYEGFMQAIKKNGELNRMIDRAYKDDDDSSGYSDYSKGASKIGFKIIPQTLSQLGYDNTYQNDMPIITKSIERNDVSLNEVGVIKHLMGREYDKYSKFYEMDSKELLRYIQNSSDFRNELSQLAIDVYNKEVEQAERRGRRASVISQGSTINDDINTLEDLNIDPDQPNEDIEQQLQAQISGGSPKKGKSPKKEKSPETEESKEDEPDTEYTDLSRDQIIDKFDMNESFTESDRLQNLVNSINKLSENELDDLIDSVDSNFSRAEYSIQNQVINRHILKYLLYLKSEGKNLNTAQKAYNYISEEIIKAKTSKAKGGAKFREKTLYKKFTKSSKSKK